uniref:Uncharacterized protein n=1 Tax=viral metagenome TaxID=1070528 RepID=A0A6C0LSI5_9ZZZZ
MSNLFENKVMEKLEESKKGYFIIFFTYDCAYSRNALELLKSNRLNYKGYDINKIDGGIHILLNTFRKNAKNVNFDTNHTTRPLIFYEGKFIGGFDKLSNFLKNEI